MDELGNPWLIAYAWALLTVLGLLWGSWVIRTLPRYAWFGHILRAGSESLAVLAACSQVQAATTYASLGYVGWNLAAFALLVPLARDVREARRILDPAWLPDRAERHAMRQLFGGRSLGDMFMRDPRLKTWRHHAKPATPPAPTSDLPAPHGERRSS